MLAEGEDQQRSHQDCIGGDSAWQATLDLLASVAGMDPTLMNW